MTYCVGLQIDKGLIFMSDTRTNAGLDNISTFRKMHSWEVPGDRCITILSAGNLATTQSVVSQLEERAKVPVERKPSILEAPTMFQMASLIGETLRHTIANKAMTGANASSNFNATLILGGQIAGMPPRLFLIYPEGNFIEASTDTPFFQIGETKYGRPIMVRAYDRTMSFEDAIKLLCVSFDSTIKANLSVGLPLDLQLIETNALKITYSHRFERDDPYYDAVSRQWGNELRKAFVALPDYSLSK